MDCLSCFVPTPRGSRRNVRQLRIREPARRRHQRATIYTRPPTPYPWTQDHGTDKPHIRPRIVTVTRPTLIREVTVTRRPRTRDVVEEDRVRIRPQSRHVESTTGTVSRPRFREHRQHRQEESIYRRQQCQPQTSRRSVSFEVPQKVRQQLRREREEEIRLQVAAQNARIQARAPPARYETAPDELSKTFSSLNLGED